VENDVHVDEKLGQLYEWNIVFKTQIPQSPDMNILDIGVFNGIQAMSNEYRTDSSSVSDLVTRVTNTFYRYPQQNLDNCSGVLHEK
jgi:hypothetical protein